MEKERSFLCNFAGFSSECVSNCPEDEATSLKNIGRSVLLTTIFAFVSSILFLKETEISNNLFFILFLAGLWSFSIFSIDRYSVSILNYSDSFIKNFIKALPRFLLSIAIAILIAAPVHVGIFNSDINEKIDSQKRQKIKKMVSEIEKEKDEIQRIYADSISNLRIERINSKENIEYNNLYKKRGNFNKYLVEINEYLSKNCDDLKNANISTYKSCKFKDNEKNEYISKINDVDKKVNIILNKARKDDESDLNDAKYRKDISTVELNKRRYHALSEAKRDGLSIFEKEEILFNEINSNILLFIGFYSIILIFWIIDFYPVIAKLSNPTISYDKCITDKKKSYTFKRNLSNRLDKYLSFRGYNNNKIQIQDREVWNFSSGIEKGIFKDVYEHYATNVTELSKEKITEWSDSFKNKPFKNSGVLEKLFYEYFNKSIHGKEHLDNDINTPRSMQYGFISFPLLINISIVMVVVFVAIFIINGGVESIEDALEIVVSLALLIEFFKITIFKLIRKLV